MEDSSLSLAGLNAEVTQSVVLCLRKSEGLQVRLDSLHGDGQSRYGQHVALGAGFRAGNTFLVMQSMENACKTVELHRLAN